MVTMTVMVMVMVHGDGDDKYGAGGGPKLVEYTRWKGGGLDNFDGG